MYKPRLHPSAYTSLPLYEFVRACLGENEIPDDLLTLAHRLIEFALRDTQERPLTESQEEILIVTPYYPRTLNIFLHLEATGALKVVRKNFYGTAYSLNVPRTNHREWVFSVFQEMVRFSGSPNHASLTNIRKSLMQTQPDSASTIPPDSASVLV
jgi:hypothetical protein